MPTYDALESMLISCPRSWASSLTLTSSRAAWSLLNGAVPAATGNGE